MSEANLHEAPQVKKTSKAQKVKEYLKKNWHGLLQHSFIVIGICGFIVYLGVSTNTFVYNQLNPTTSIIYEEQKQQMYPTVTVCNYNSYAGDCDFCTLRLISCDQLGLNVSDTNCTEKMRYKEFEAVDGQYRCYQFNWDEADLQNTNLIDYSGSTDLLFTVNPVVNASAEYRNAVNGLQVTFHSHEEEPQVFSEINFAPVGIDTYYSLEKIEELYMRAPKRERWLTNARQISLPDSNYTDGTLMIGISFGFHSLATKIVQEKAVGEWFGFFADLGGVCLLLTSIQLVKVLHLIASIPYGLAKKSAKPYHETLTGRL